MNPQELVIKMALDAWETQIRRAGELIDGFSDEQMLHEIAPGKNRAIYLAGHLVAIHDAMNDILGIGERSHAELDEVFVKNPDKTGIAMPSVSTIRKYWKEVHASLHIALYQITTESWFGRHCAMSDEDFSSNPLRNKLSVLINRTNHAAFHLGQLRLLK